MSDSNPRPSRGIIDGSGTIVGHSMMANLSTPSGIEISFSAQFRETGKSYLLIKVPRRAARVLTKEPCTIVVAMTDLYPRDEAFRHGTVEELEAGIHSNFNAALQHSDTGCDKRLRERFKVFCFKYDLEALILASEEALKKQLGLSRLEATWRKPVEEQNHDLPPKKIVEKLFEENGPCYSGPVDAPLILSKANYQDIAEKCSQCFKPFVEFLTGLQPVM